MDERKIARAVAAELQQRGMQRGQRIRDRLTVGEKAFASLFAAVSVVTMIHSWFH